MLKDTVLKALSDQVNAEYYSAYLYLAMSACADRMSFKGAANWLFVQFQEEMAHGTHIYQHILERGGMPSFGKIDPPEADFASLTDIYQKVLSHEQHVTELINNIATLAMQENDHSTYNFIMWFVNEQVEEEANADEILSKLRFMKDDASLHLNLDATLAQRVFVDPFPPTAAN